MAASFEYKPRFTDMRISKPGKAGAAEAKNDVLRLKPGEKPCDQPECRKAATARAPKSREHLNEFYNFCQTHAAEYNKAWNFYAGMNEAQIRAAKENEAMTGGRPTWDMKASKNSREAATLASKGAKPGVEGEGSWRDSYGLFSNRRTEQTGSAPSPESSVGKIERGALMDLGLEPGVSKAVIKAAYHDLLKRCHPDHNGGDRGAEAKLVRVIKAWKTLKKAGIA